MLRSMTLGSVRNEHGGKVRGTVGDLTGRKRDSLESRIREAQGAAETLYNQANRSDRAGTAWSDP